MTYASKEGGRRYSRFLILVVVSLFFLLFGTIAIGVSCRISLNSFLCRAVTGGASVKEQIVKLISTTERIAGKEETLSPAEGEMVVFVNDKPRTTTVQDLIEGYLFNVLQPDCYLKRESDSLVCASPTNDINLSLEFDETTNVLMLGAYSSVDLSSLKDDPLVYSAGEGLALKPDNTFAIDAPVCAEGEFLSWNGTQFVCNKIVFPVSSDGEFIGYWKRVGTNLSPLYSGDDLVLGNGEDLIMTSLEGSGILYLDADKKVKNSSALVWNESTQTLGIGTLSLSGDYRLEVQGGVRFLTENDGFTWGPLGIPSNLPEYLDYIKDCGAIIKGNGQNIAFVCTRVVESGTSVIEESVVIVAEINNNALSKVLAVVKPTEVLGDKCSIKKNSIAYADVDGDFQDELVIGCYDASGSVTQEGKIIISHIGTTQVTYEVLTRSGATAYDQCGYSVDVVDINGDGRKDIIAGCPGLDNGTTLNTGGAVIFLRNATNDGFEVPTTVASTYSYATCGDSIAGYDINNDGKGDIVLGCPQLTDTVTNQGGALVYLRNSTNDGFDAGTLLLHPSPASYDRCGSVVTAGDINSDTFGDVVMGCMGDDVNQTDEGSAVAFLRDSTNAGFLAGTVLSSPAPQKTSYCGNSVLIVDIDGDNKQETLVGCYRYDVNGVTDSGAFLIFEYEETWSSGYLQLPSVVQQDGWCANSLWAQDLDINSSGLEVLVGCPYVDSGIWENKYGGSGVMFLHRSVTGSSIGKLDKGVQLVYPVVDGSQCGKVVASGDINNDGYDDLIIGCASTAFLPGDLGAFWVYTYDPSSSTYSFDSLLWDDSISLTPWCAQGDSVAIADINGDGYGDVIVGCARGDLPDVKGMAIVFERNSSNDGFNTPYHLVPTSAAGFAECGTTVAVGDVNGDGKNDVLLGCPYDTSLLGNDEGSVAIFLRNSTNTGFTYYGQVYHPNPVVNARCGKSVAAVDVTGDSTAEVIFGCYRYDGSVSRMGGVAVLKWNGSSFVQEAELFYPNPSGWEYCGFSVSVGDFNGDGKNDIFMGCPWDGMTGSGVAFLRKSDNSGFDSGTVLPGVDHMWWYYGCGERVEAGDIDGDGKDEALLGCTEYPNYYDAEGAVLVFDWQNNQFDSGTLVDYQFKDRQINGTDPKDWCATDIAVGDFDNDGKEELVLGCQGMGVRGGSDGGAIVMKIFGSPIDTLVVKKGKVGILTNNPQYQLQVGNPGSDTYAIANAWLTFSDIRFKENINPLENSLEKVLKLRGVSFVWKDSRIKDVGFIAQEVKKVLPEIVRTAPDGTLSLDYTDLIPYLVEAVKELSTQINTSSTANWWSKLDEGVITTLYPVRVSELDAKNAYITNLNTSLLSTTTFTVGNGALIVDEQGNLTSEGILTVEIVDTGELNTKVIKVTGDYNGRVTVPASETTVRVEIPGLDPNDTVLVTPIGKDPVRFSVEISDGFFDLYIEPAQQKDLEFVYIVVKR